MKTEQIIRTLIYTHAIFGGIALASGSISLIAKKGNLIHKKSGKLFFYAMLLSAFTALLISISPKHENPFLFSIGIFSAYLIVTGYRALNFKNKNIDLVTDKIIAWIMLVTGALMILYNPVINQKINIVLTVFGAIGSFLAARDLILFKNASALGSSWLKLHLGKMIGGYIAATTAFVVVNNFFPSVYGWFIPGIIGGVYINYWTTKLKKKD